MNRQARAAILTLLIVAAFVAWYVIASGYDYGDLAGTYTSSGNGQFCTLVLKSDGTFEQALTHDDKVDHSTGTWHRIGEGGVTFSGDFIRLPEQQTYRDKFGPDQSGNTTADSEFGGHFEKVLGLYPILHLDGAPTDLTLHKHLFH